MFVSSYQEYCSRVRQCVEQSQLEIEDDDEDEGEDAEAEGANMMADSIGE